MSIVHVPPEALDARNTDRRAQRAAEKLAREERLAPLHEASAAISAASRHIRHAVMASEEVQEGSVAKAVVKLREALATLERQPG